MKLTDKVKTLFLALSIATATQARQPGYRLEVVGNPAIGTVYHIKQAHRAEGYDSWQRQTIINLQEQIFRDIQKSGLTDIFAEGAITDIIEGYTPETMQQRVWQEMDRERIQQIFPEGIPSQMSEKQKRTIYDIGAGVVYAHLNQNIRLFRTETQEVRDAGLSVQGSFNNLTEFDRYKLFEFREEKTFEFIEEFLQKNPGAKVILLYGGGHDFTEEAKKANVRLYTKTYPIVEEMAKEVR